MQVTETTFPRKRRPRAPESGLHSNDHRGNGNESNEEAPARRDACARGNDAGRRDVRSRGRRDPEPDPRIEGTDRAPVATSGRAVAPRGGDVRAAARARACT